MSRFSLMIGWEEIPHLTEKAKADMMEALPPFQRDARSKGIPQLGAGAIYPVPESDIIVPDFEIPKHWPRVYALDVGWRKTAALWMAIDRESDIGYLYSEYYRGEAEPAVHAQSILSRGSWIPGIIDPAARGRAQRDGHNLMDIYKGLGLDLSLAINVVESGIYDTWQRLSSGRLKAFKSLTNFRSEIRIYRRNEKGQIVKENDHLMDDMRYLVNSGFDRAKQAPDEKKIKHQMVSPGQTGGWMR